MYILVGSIDIISAGPQIDNRLVTNQGSGIEFKGETNGDMHSDKGSSLSYDKLGLRVHHFDNPTLLRFQLGPGPGDPNDGARVQSRHPIRISRCLLVDSYNKRDMVVNNGDKGHGMGTRGKPTYMYIRLHTSVGKHGQ